MTPDEKRWFSRLRRVLNDMPDTVELQVHHATLQMNRRGAREDHFEKFGDADEVEELDSFQINRVYPCSESM